LYWDQSLSHVWHHPFSAIYDAGSLIIDLHRKFLFLDFAARKTNIFSRPDRYTDWFKVYMHAVALISLFRACWYGGELPHLPGKTSYSPRRDKHALCLYGTELLGICCMIATWRRNSARTQKGFKVVWNVKNIPKCGEKIYRFIMYFWVIIFQMQSTYILSRAAELPGQSVYMVKYSSRLGDIPPLSTGISPRRVTRLHHVNSRPGLL
jgi:hypothetical protein